MDRTRALADRRLLTAVCLVVLTLLVAPVSTILSHEDAALVDPPTRRVNMPYLGSGPPEDDHDFKPAIFWFGKVKVTTNYADVRMWHYDDYMKVMVNVVDRLVWYERDPTDPALQSDAVALYLDLDGNTGSALDQNSYKFVAQISHQAGYRGNGSGWSSDPVPFTASAIYRGHGVNNDLNDSGWQATFVIPFASLGVSEPPPLGTVWGLAVSVHDRDDAGNSPIPDQVWPENMDPASPNTWGELAFGVPFYQPKPSAPQGSITLRHQFNGANVPDVYAGGFGPTGGCGVDLDRWLEWGEWNYAGEHVIKVQNQWDISEFPCFSKYFVTFPLDDVPPGKTILHATLQMRLAGNSVNPKGETPDSYIQVLTIDEPWQENTLTWNNAPLAVENITGTWVKPSWLSPDPFYKWNVSLAVAEAYRNGEPLRLAMYSADGPQHTGKYFRSSDSGSPGALQRPQLHVIWGAICGSQGIECHYSHLPMISN